jgi:hypothetical protein
VAGLPDFSIHNIPKRGKLYQIATKLPNGHKMFQIAVIYSNLFYSNLPKFGIFGLKIYHLAALLGG